MSNFENIDDELLSAYLDDELSPDERARVEARLAADPAAQQLHSDLRFASFAIQSLPDEAVGHDLRESVLRRAEQAKLAAGGAAADGAPANEPVRLSDPAPQFTIGRTRRGWIWATVAMAAGIAIMFLQPGDDQDASLPPVAVKGEGAVDQVAAADGASVPELRQQSDPVAPQSAPAEAMVAEAAVEAPPITSGEVGELLAAAKPQAMPRDQLRGGSTSASGEAPASQDELLVVHVVVQQAALENKSFDRLLAEQGIPIEEPVEEPPTSGDADAATERELAESDDIDRRLDRFGGTAQDTEVVLLEAPAATIESFVAAINKDEQNYAGVLVDDVSARDKASDVRAATATNLLKNKFGYDLKTKFDRGQGPSPRDVELGRSSDRYFFLDDNSTLGGYGRGGYGEGAYGEGAYGGALKQEAESQRETSSLGVETSKEGSRGRAIRQRSWQFKDRVGDQITASAKSRQAVALGRSASDESLSFGAVQQEANAPAAEAGGNLQVLFILSPAGPESAPSPPADNRAE